MEIRTFTQKDDDAYEMLTKLCFAVPADKDYEEQLKKPDRQSKDLENKIGGFDDKGNLMAGLDIAPFKMNFDGHTVPMAGVQGVITVPEARGSGVMSKIMAESLRIMKDRGYVFSMLYPFSYAYYRKFGYEAAYQPNKASIPTEIFTNYPFPKDSVRFWNKGDSICDLKTVYEVFRKNRNYAIERDDECWAEIMKDDPFIKMRYTYIHYDAQNKPDAYLIFKVGDRKSDDPVDLNVDELVWTSDEGLYSFLGFIGGLRPQFETVCWDVPTDVNIYTLFPEAWDISVSSPATVMNRIIDLPAALKLLRAPALFNGQVVLDVLDKSLPYNTGRYAISWNNGKISVETTDKAPDMSTTIEAMAQLTVGYITPDQAVYRKDTVIHGNIEMLMALFPKKDLYLWERF